MNEPSFGFNSEKNKDHKASAIVK